MIKLVVWKDAFSLVNFRYNIHILWAEKKDDSQSYRQRRDWKRENTRDFEC